MKIPVGVSNRHIHLTKESVDILFGEGYLLTKRNDLTQPGQFACNETLTIKTQKCEITGVRILGPVRNYNQVEISKTDSYKLGLNPPVRNSGDVADSEVVTLIGPKGELEVSGCIIASRHVHISKSEAAKLNLKDDDIVRVKVDTLKGGILDNVHIKVLDEAYLELHLDTDDANSHLLKQNDIVEIIDLNN